MINDVLQTTSVERLKGILKDRYGKGLELSFLNDTNSVELAGSAFSMKSGVLQIPIYSTTGQFMAVAKVPEADSLNHTSREAITEIVRLVLEPALTRWVLLQNEQNLEVAQLHRIGGLELVRGEQELPPTDGSDVSPIILITSSNPHRIPRLAILAHEIMGRWAFVNWREVSEQIKSVQDLRDMGAMTLFVEDVLQLRTGEKALLNDWIETSHGDSEPAVILGSTMKWEELRAGEVLPGALLDEAGQRQIEADRLPADRKFTEEAIKLLLDKEACIHNH